MEEARFIELDLGDFARGYAVGRLEGQLGLALTSIDLWRYAGRIVAVVPEGTDYQTAVYLSSPVDVEGGYGGWLAQNLARLRGGGFEGTLVLHEYWADASDLTVRPHLPENYFIEGSGVYYNLDSESWEEEKILEFLSETPPFFNFIACTTRRRLSEADFGTGRCVEPDTIVEIVKDVQEMYLNVYDGEGWLVWRGV